MLWSLSPGSGRLFTPWMIQFALIILQKFFLIEIIQVYIVHVLTLHALRPQLKQIYNILTDIALHNTNRMNLLNIEHIRLVQHFSASCRIARTKSLLHLPIASILRQIDDYDIALCREGRGHYIGFIGKIIH